MGHYLVKTYRQFSRLPVLIISGTVMAGMYALMFATQMQKVREHATELQFAFTVQRALKVVALWGGDGIDAYLASMWMDFIFPLGYGIFLSGLMALLVLRSTNTINKMQQVFIGLPVLALVCDYIGKSMHLFMFSQGWIPDARLLLGASLAACCKWGLLLAAALLLVYYFYQGWIRSKGKKGDTP
ncbi:hypothetical protein JW933_01740 [candidate division FCPU426 bacterium]|nr:hypothetical protein [candidate division FCPU426 bacterium]